jgi:hypothetical protein
VQVLKKMAKDFYIFFDAEAGYRNNSYTDKYKSYAGDVRSKMNAGYIGASVGIAYQLCKKQHVELTLPSIYWYLAFSKFELQKS